MSEQLNQSEFLKVGYEQAYESVRDIWKSVAQATGVVAIAYVALLAASVQFTNSLILLISGFLPLMFLLGTRMILNWIIPFQFACIKTEKILGLRPDLGLMGLLVQYHFPQAYFNNFEQILEIEDPKEQIYRLKDVRLSDFPQWGKTLLILGTVSLVHIVGAVIASVFFEWNYF